MLAADFTVQFGQIFAGQADNQVTVTLTNAPASGGTLNAWIDFDGDGQFFGAAEKVFSGRQLSQGGNSLEFSIPFSVSADNRIARFVVDTADPAQSTVNTSVPTSVWLSEPVIGPRHALSGVFGPSDILSADFDNDGDTDVFTANITGSSLSYYENNGVGVFTERTMTGNFSGALQTLEATDLNNDGLLDIVAGTISTSLIDGFLQTSPGVFTAFQIPANDGADHVAIADFNGDGLLDLLKADQNVTLLTNSASGIFTSLTIDTSNAFLSGLAVGDIDGDGDIDAVATNRFEIVLYRNNGSGVFTVVNDFITATEITETIRVIDFDRDGRLDIVSTRFLLGEIYWFENTGGTFIEHTTDVPGGQDDIKLGDINGDGSVDILTASVLAGADIYLNSGDNLTFTHINIHDLLSESVEAVDIDGDGDLDIVTEEGNHIVWYENTSIPASPIVVSVSSATIGEDAGTVGGTVQRPAGTSSAAPLQVTLTSSNPSAATVPGIVTIAANSSSAAFDVTIPDDLLADGNQTVTISATSSGLASGTVTLTVIDNEVAGFAIIESASETTVSEDGTTDSFDVVLTSEPQSDVTILLQNGATSQLSLDTTSLTFTQANWNLPQTVAVSPVDDTVADGSVTAIVTLQIDTVLSDSAFASVSNQELNIVVTDNEIAAITVDVASVSVSENQTEAIVQVALAEQPVGDVFLTISNSDPSEAIVGNSSLAFTTTNWNIPQPVTITGVDDLSVDGTVTVQVTLTVDAAASADAYDNAAPVVIDVANADNDTAGLFVSETALTVGEDGTTATFDVVLSAAPVTNVQITAVSADADVATTSPVALTFTPDNWDQPQTVTVRGTDDPVADGDQITQVNVTVDAASSDDAFDSVIGRAITVTTTDDDIVGFTVSATTATLTESDTDSVGIDVQLTAQPLSDVLITVSESDLTEATVSPSTLTFTPQNWQAVQTITIVGVSDDTVDGDQQSTVTVSVDAAASEDSFDNVLTRRVDVTTVDNDVAGFVLDRSSVVVSEDGTTADIGIVLTAAPFSQTVLTLHSSNPEQASINVSTLTFTADNWDQPQFVTVSGVNDEFLDGAGISEVVISVDVAATDTEFQNLPDKTVTVTVDDDDRAGFLLTKQTGSVNESGTFDVFGVSLNVAPTTPVTLQVKRRSSGEVLESPNTLVFTSQNWNVPQTVRVVGVDDAVIDGPQTTFIDILVDVEQSDDAFDGLSAQSVVITTEDNDTDDIRPTVTGPAGRTDSDRPTITWNAVTGATSYEVWLEDRAASEVPVRNPTVVGTAYRVTSALPMGRYRAWVRANFGNGTRSSWTSDTFDIIPVVAVQPLDFHATDRTPTIRWNSIPGATDYRIFVRNDTDPNANVFDTIVAGTEFTVPSDLQFGRHQIWVRAIASGGLQTAWSAPVGYYIGPSLLSPVGAGHNDRPTFAWDTLAGIGSFQLHVRRGNTVVLDDTGLTSTLHTPSVSLSDGDYHWWIRPSTFAGGVGAWSPAGRFNIGGRPEGIAVDAGDNADAVTITWDAVDGAIFYEVFVRDGSRIVGQFSGVNGTEYTVPFPLTDGNHHVWVRSGNGLGQSSVWSSRHDFNVSAATDSVVARPLGIVTPTFERPVQLRWTSTENAETFDVVYEHQGTVRRLNAVVGNAWVLPENITSGQVRWWVRAHSAEGTGSWSRESVLEPDPRPIANTAINPDGGTTITWTPVIGAVRYVLQINDLNDNSVVREDALFGARYVAVGLPTGNYRVWVQAINAAGQRSPWSRPAQFITS